MRRRFDSPDLATRSRWGIALLVLGGIPAALLAEKQRVFVLTDISNEPDDEESMVRFLVYSNEYDIEGLVATTSTWLREKTREDLIRRQIDAFGQVRPNLVKHAGGYPTTQELLAVTSTGQAGFGMAQVGEGKTTPGSRLLLKSADRDDERPLWISVWGGVNTLAQALQDARRERPPGELEKLIKKLRVYTISDQDDAGRWLRLEFPELFYVVSPSTTDSREYHRATWTGISGDRHYKNGPFFHFDLVDNPWLTENVIENHGALGALYPKVAYFMDGDTPSFLGLIDNGVGWTPARGGWGGRYSLYRSYAETRRIWTNNRESRDTIALDGLAHTSDQATIWRWRKHFQHDFAARMDWCVAVDFDQANHNPIAHLNGDSTHDTLELTARPGEKIRLSSAGSRDPDGDAVTASWQVYREAGTLKADVKLSARSGPDTELTVPTSGPRNRGSRTLHVILTVEDGGTPSLVAYRRAIITIR